MYARQISFAKLPLPRYLTCIGESSHSNEHQKSNEQKLGNMRHITTSQNDAGCVNEKDEIRC